MLPLPVIPLSHSVDRFPARQPARRAGVLPKQRGGMRVLATRWSRLAAMLLAGWATRALGADHAGLIWDAGSEPDLAGYRVYFRTAGEEYGPSIDVGLATTTTVSNLVAGTTYYFAVTAYNTVGLESGHSEEITFTATPNATTTTITGMERLADGAFRFLISSAASAVQTLNIHVSSNLKDWSLLAGVVNPTGKLLITDPGAAGATQRFYRVSEN